jgi:superfamily II DNA/RNA helicase
LKVNRFFDNNLRSRVVLSRVVLTVIMLQVGGSIDDLLRRSGRSGRGCKEGLVLIYDTQAHGWSRGPDSPHMKNGAACTIVQC